MAFPFNERVSLYFTHILMNFLWLQGYALDFTLFAGDWQGAVATITRAPDQHVWGVVYEVENCDLANLDR